MLNFKTKFSLEGRLHLKKTQIIFGFLFDLHYLCTLIETKENALAGFKMPLNAKNGKI